MAYIALLRRARTIENYKRNYEKEKHNAILLANVEVPSETRYERFKHSTGEHKRKILRILRRTFIEKTKISNCILYIKTDQTFANFILKSILGFVGGIILTYFCFLFFVFQLSISLTHATIMSSIIGISLTLGLAFSYRIRCLVFLLIPQFFSRVGRYTLTCYALVLILTGPATNTLKNSEVLSESMACGQEQTKTIVRQINESFDKPLNSVRDSIKTLLENIKTVAAKLNEVLTKLKIIFLSSVSVLEESTSWLNSIVVNCNKKVGSPYERCLTAFEASQEDCKAHFGPKHAWVCNLDHAKTVCWSLKHVEDFCVAVDFVLGGITAVVRKRLQEFSRRVKLMLFVKVHIHHSYFFSTNGTRSASQVAAGIVTEIRNRADPLMTWLSWSSYVTSFSLLLIISRAKYYQNMYETRSSYDNRYINKELMDLDFKRMKQGKETVLPLNRRERAKYTSTLSFRLVAPDKLYLSRSLVFMTITTFKLMIHMVADYSLYWILMTIRHHGRLETPLDVKRFHDSFTISGNGFIANFIRALISSLKISVFIPASSPTTCLPNPHEPDFRRYAQIGILILLLWFSSLFEPYGLRLRHMVMGLYRPERAVARAEWLFNHILRNRVRFLKFARRKLHRQYKYSAEEKLTFKHWMREHIPCKCLLSLLGCSAPKPLCLLCGIVERLEDTKTTLIRCETPNCPGQFCQSCFYEIGELCTICMSPADYGDLSDASLEKGSSDDSSDDDDDENDNKGNRETKILLQKFEGKNNAEKTKRIYDYYSSELSSDNYYQKTKYKGRKRGTSIKCNLVREMSLGKEIPDYQTECHIKFNDVQDVCLRNLVEDLKNNNIDIKHFNDVLSGSLLENKFIRNAIECLTTPRKRRSKTKIFERATLNRKFNSCHTIFNDLLLNIAKSFSDITSKAIKRCKSYEISISSSSIRIQTNNKTMHRKHVRKKSFNLRYNERNKYKTNQSKDINILTDYQNRILNYGNSVTVAARIRLQSKRHQQNGDRNQNDTPNKKKKFWNYKKTIQDITTADILKKDQGDYKTVPNLGTTLKSQTAVHRLSTFCSYKNVFNDTEPNYKKRKRKKMEFPKGHKSTDPKLEIKSDREYRLTTYFLKTNWGYPNNVFAEYQYNKYPEPESKNPTKMCFIDSKEASDEPFIFDDDRNAPECSKRLNHTPKPKTDKKNKQNTFAARASVPYENAAFSNIYDNNVNADKNTTKKITKKNKTLKPSQKSRFVHETTAAVTSVSKDTNDHSKTPEYYLQKFLTYFRSVSQFGYLKKSSDTKKKANTSITIDEGLRQEHVDNKSVTYVNRVIVIDGIKAFTKKVSRKVSRLKKDEKKNPKKTHTKEKPTKMADVGTNHESKEYTNTWVQCEGHRHRKSKPRPTTPTFYGDYTTVNNLCAVRHDKRIKDSVPKPRLDKHNRDQMWQEESPFQSGDFYQAENPTLIPRSMKHSMPEGCKKRQFETPYKTKQSTFDKAVDSQYVITDHYRKFKGDFDAQSVTSDATEDTKTDQTICSHVALQYEKQDYKRRIKCFTKPKIKTKANRSTLTENANLCNASTLTDDWWTPILERKNVKTDLTDIRKRNAMMSSKRPFIAVDCGIPRRKREREEERRSGTKNVLTRGKLISFKSQAQIIPGFSQELDILSPSRYLLESQRYYNELYCPQDHVRPQPTDYHFSKVDSDRKSLYPSRGMETPNRAISHQEPNIVVTPRPVTSGKDPLQFTRTGCVSSEEEEIIKRISPKTKPLHPRVVPVKREYEIQINVTRGADTNVMTSMKRRGYNQKPVILCRRTRGQQTSFDRIDARSRAFTKQLTKHQRNPRDYLRARSRETIRDESW